MTTSCGSCCPLSLMGSGLMERHPWCIIPKVWVRVSLEIITNILASTQTNYLVENVTEGEDIKEIKVFLF